MKSFFVEFPIFNLEIKNIDKYKQDLEDYDDDLELYKNLKGDRPKEPVPEYVKKVTQTFIDLSSYKCTLVQADTDPTSKDLVCKAEFSPRLDIISADTIVLQINMSAIEFINTYSLLDLALEKFENNIANYIATFGDVSNTSTTLDTFENHQPDSTTDDLESEDDIELDLN